MDKETAKTKIKETLTRMGSMDVSFEETDENTILVKFNCDRLTSFVEEIIGWSYSGISLDPTKERQYKINFKKK